MSAEKIRFYGVSIMLAILATALWEELGLRFLFKSFLSFISLAASFGLEGLSNSVYREIARFDNNNEALHTMTLVTLIVSFGPIISLLIYNIFAIRSERKVAILRSSTTKKLWTFLILLFFYYQYAGIREIYIATSKSILAEYRASVGPYVDEQTRLQFVSRQSRIRSSADLKSLANDLKSLAEKHGHPVNTFFMF